MKFSITLRRLWETLDLVTLLTKSLIENFIFCAVVFNVV